MSEPLFVPFVINKPSVYQALSELMINALNETFFCQSEDVEIFQVDGKWTIRDFGRGLQLPHFTHSENIEKLFYKDAITPSRMKLVEAISILINQNIDITIFSKQGVFTFECSDFKPLEGSGTLKINWMEPFDSVFKGTLIEITGVEEADILKARAMFLKFSRETVVENTPYGQIIKNPEEKGALFVNGVKIAECPKFYYKYNITKVPESLHKDLNTNLFNIPIELYEGIIKKIIFSSRSYTIAEEVLRLHAEDNHDTSYQDISWDDVTLHFIKVLNQKGDFVFISKLDYQFHIRYTYLSEVEGMKTIYVQDHIMRTLYGLYDYNHNLIFLKKDLLQKNKAKTYTLISYNVLDQSEKKIYSNLKRLLELFGGLPFEVKKIRIFELDNSNIETAECKHLMGIWEKATKTILINKLALCSLNEFASVLFHELIHAKYDCKDLTLDFEIRLSETMGDLVARYIEDIYFDFD